VTPRSALTRGLVCLVPVGLAAALRLSLPLVVLAALLGVVVMLVGVVTVLITQVRTEAGSSFAVAAQRRVVTPVRRPRDLERLQTLVAGRSPTAIGVQQWVRPLLADIAATRLRLGQGIDLTDPAAAELVPEPLWDLIRPGRPEPADRNGPGLTMPELTQLVDQLEAL